MSEGLDLRGLARRGPVHFMGVAGAGMCALAELLLRLGGTVTGCDLAPGRSTEALVALGAEIHEGHDPGHVADVTAVVVSAAVPPDHAELEAARARGVPVVKRARALGSVVNRGTVVAVAGTHGKTSTTAMATQILAEAGRNPTGFVGGRVKGWGGNLRFGSDELFVVEADEYDRSFHALEPTVAVVTNVEADHLDVYGDLEGVRSAYRAFVLSVPERGRVVACGDDSGASRLLPELGRRGWAYGLNPGPPLRAEDVRVSGTESRFRVVEEGRDRGGIRLRVPGVHHVRNALGAAGAARQMGVEWEAIRRGLESYRGVGRRFQCLGTADGVRVVDDYAHHPTEVRATLEAARAAFPEARIVAVFQPHLYTRTRDFAVEFGRALSRADEVWVTDVYPAREEPIPGIDGELVARAVEEGEGAPRVRYHAALEGLADALAESLAPGDVCLTLGAGSIEEVGPRILVRLGAGPENGAGGPGEDDRA
ncbi:MAG TPA: UDP-N-acetylmuramate--L-alanine ligase [Longimicrobiales bacterium]|nr:UDP-N-acetylmuramate--L-alanine ligase [Longimicrobiales bacterium]